MTTLAVTLVNLGSSQAITASSGGTHTRSNVETGGSTLGDCVGVAVVTIGTGVVAMVVGAGGGAGVHPANTTTPQTATRKIVSIRCLFTQIIPLISYRRSSVQPTMCMT